jgi:hypothetical protein
MSITTLQRSINRRLIDTNLQVLRLPLTAVERITNKTEVSDWPPAVAFESFEATAKKVLGSILRDDELVEQGRLLEAKVSELAEAERLETKADMQREAAAAELQQKQEAATRAREAAERKAEEREAALDREKAAKKRQVTETARKREAAVDKADELRDRVITAQERAAKRTRIVAESAALEDKSEALGAAKKAEVLDRTLQAKKAQRAG